MHFQSENAAFKFHWRRVDGASVAQKEGLDCCKSQRMPCLKTTQINICFTKYIRLSLGAKLKLPRQNEIHKLRAFGAVNVRSSPKDRCYDDIFNDM